MDMNPIDLVSLLLIAASALLGAVRGLIGVVASLLAWLGAGWVAFSQGARLAFWFSDDGMPGATELLGGYAVSFIGVLVLAGMVLMAWNTWKTLQMVKSPAPHPVLPAHVSEAKV